MAVTIEKPSGEKKEYNTTGLLKKNKPQEYLVISGDTRFVIKLGAVLRCSNDTQENCNILVNKFLDMLKEFSVSQGGSNLRIEYVLAEKEN